MALANLVSVICPQIEMVRIAKGTHPIRNSKDCQSGASFVNPKPINFLYIEISGFDKGSLRVMALANLVSLLFPKLNWKGLPKDHLDRQRTTWITKGPQGLPKVAKNFL